MEYNYEMFFIQMSVFRLLLINEGFICSKYFECKLSLDFYF